MHVIEWTFVYLIITALVAGGVLAVVAIGMQGKLRERFPKAADRLARTAQALNGDGEPPAKFERFVEKASQYQQRVRTH